METKYNLTGIVNNGTQRTVMLKAERPGSPLDEAVAKILHQLDIEGGTEEQRQAVLDQVRIQLHDLFPSGNWISVSTREEALKEVERVKKQLQEEREQDPNTSLRTSLKNAKNSIERALGK